jgi:hypothetical protein
VTLVNLRDFLLAVATEYDPAQGFDTDAQRHLKSAVVELASYGPADFVVRASGGQYPLRTTDTPWIGFFDPDESKSPTEGLYVVWILRADRSAWTLSVNMGTERLSQRLAAEPQTGAGPREPRVRLLLSAEASVIRAAMNQEELSQWSQSMSLNSGGTRQRRYEAATVVAKEYPLEAFVNEETLSHDLDEACTLLSRAIEAKHRLAVTEPGSISTASATFGDGDHRNALFEPGEDHETTIVLSKTSITRTPRHESGLRRYGTWLKQRGLTPTTKVYPRDFVILGSPAWTGEYKVVYGGNDTRATREAHSQLKEYRYFYSPEAPHGPLLAVFNAAISKKRVDWLNAEGIAVVWDDAGTWRGCPIAQEAGLSVAD